MELEEQSVEHLPDRCQSCGTPLTEREKAAALEEGGSLVLCATCAAESQAMPEEEAEDVQGS